MMQKSRLLAFAAGCLAAMLIMGSVFAANGGPVELTGDVIEYDSVQGVMTAQGNVRLLQEGAVMTGANAQYNTKSKEAFITGGVRYVKDDITLTSQQVSSFQDNHLIAQGDAVLVKGQNTLYGPQIDYYADRQYALVDSGARLDMPDGTMTADKVEAFIAEDRAVGTNNVHIVSSVRSLDATAQQAVFYGIKGSQDAPGKIVLTGSPRVVQDGNVLTGNTMTIYLDEKAMDAQGRSKLVVRPQQ